MMRLQFLSDDSFKTYGSVADSARILHVFKCASNDMLA